MKIVIPGEPIAKARHRCSCRGRIPVAYDPKAKQNEIASRKLLEIIQSSEITQNDLDAVYSSHLYVSLSYSIQVPLSDSAPRKRQNLWFGMPNRVDLDNLIKQTLDIANEILWHDDSQIVNLTASMRFSETPCTIIEISPINISMGENEKKVAKIFTPNELDLLRDHVKLLSDTLNLPRASDDPFELLEDSSFELIAFSNDWGQKLQKLAKL